MRSVSAVTALLTPTGAENKPYRLVRFDMSSNLLKDRHHIRTVPMFLMYFGGRLVYANNTFNGLGQSLRHPSTVGTA